MGLGYTFDEDLGNYSLSGTATAEWVDTHGNPSPGCIHFADSAGDSALAENTTDTDLIGAGLHFYVNWRVDFAPASAHPGDAVLTLTALLQNGGEFVREYIYFDDIPDNGWHQLTSAEIPMGFGNVVGFQVSFAGTIEAGNPCHAYIDTILVGTSPPPIIGTLTHSSGGLPGSVMI